MINEEFKMFANKLAYRFLEMAAICIIIFQIFYFFGQLYKLQGVHDCVSPHGIVIGLIEIIQFGIAISALYGIFTKKTKYLMPYCTYHFIDFCRLFFIFLFKCISVYNFKMIIGKLELTESKDGLQLKQIEMGLNQDVIQSTHASLWKNIISIIFLIVYRHYVELAESKKKPNSKLEVVCFI